LDFYLGIAVEILTESADEHIKASSGKIIIGFPKIIQNIISGDDRPVMLQKI
jgi:hypothetical protein